MTKRKVLIVVEGQHDEAFVGQLLRRQFGFKVQVRLSGLDPFWSPTVPKTYPVRDDLRARVAVPYFYFNDDVSVAVVVAVGDTNLAHVALDTVAVVDKDGVYSVGVVLDADSAVPLERRFGDVQAELRSGGLVTGEHPGAVAQGQPRCGIFILPDNASQGTLESLLLECGEIPYSQALGLARNYLEAIEALQLPAEDMREYRKPSGRRKALVAAMTAFLKPGKTTHASISDNRWLDPPSLALPTVAAFSRFLSDLCS